MASRREYRAATILGMLERAASDGGPVRAGSDAIDGLAPGTTIRLGREGFDEFLYVPQRLVLGTPPTVSPEGVEFERSPEIGRQLAERLRQLPGVREIDGDSPPQYPSSSPPPSSTYRDEAGDDRGQGGTDRAGGEDPTLRRFALEPGLDSVELARRLTAEPRAAGWLAPEYVLLTHQRVLPGTDPEYGRFIGRPEVRGAWAELGAGTTLAVVDTGLAPEAQSEGYLPGVTFDPALDVDPLADPTVTKAERAEIELHLDPSARAIAEGLGDALAVLGPAAGHGTFIAGLIARLAPASRVNVLRAFGPLGAATETHVARAIGRAGTLRPDVLNLSFGMYGARMTTANGTTYFQPPLALLHAVDALPQATAVVASAGNSDSQDPMYPAAFAGVYAVAALDGDGWRWPHSNYGSWVELSARGANLDGVYVRGLENDRYDADGSPELWHDARANFARWSGTSFAAPLVAARVALVLGAARRSGLAITGRQAAEVLRWSSPPAPEWGCGRRVVADLWP
jgi:subtilisin family serine protease